MQSMSDHAVFSGGKDRHMMSKKVKRGRENEEEEENDKKKFCGRIVSAGQVIKLLHIHPNRSFELDEKALAEILLAEDVRERSVVVVSVAGAFRKGKSFLLDFFLRYMNSRYGDQPHAHSEDSWLVDDTEPLGGFSMRERSERDTTGILVWSKAFPATLPSGERVAVLLMDTQGAFDGRSSEEECAHLFTLSTMLSSVQIYNLSQDIKETDLHHLQLFMEYGAERSGSTPFQRLQFLVRDWSYPYEAAYGAEGGEKILQRRLEKISDAQHPELQSLRKNIASCFSETSCFLMPHPGLSIATNPKFDGRLAEIESEFKQQLQRFVPMLLAPENLMTKKIDGEVVKAHELVAKLKAYKTKHDEIFYQGRLPLHKCESSDDESIISELTTKKKKPLREKSSGQKAAWRDCQSVTTSSEYLPCSSRSSSSPDSKKSTSSKESRDVLSTDFKISHKFSDFKLNESAEATAKTENNSQFVWVNVLSNTMPSNAIATGDAKEKYFVGRTRHKGSTIVGKVKLSHRGFSLLSGELELTKTDCEFQILCGDRGTWVATSGNIPPNAVPAGETEDGEPLFVGRVNHEGTLTLGKVQPSHGTLYIPYGGQEVSFTDYEVLTS